MMLTLVGCEKTVPSVNMDVPVSVADSENVTKETLPVTTREKFDAVTDFEAGEPDKNYYFNNDKTIFPDGKKRYYYVYKDGRDSAYYVLGCETDDKKYSFLENADDFTAYLYKDGTFYGSYRQDKLCSFKDGKYKKLKCEIKNLSGEYEEKDISDFYFTEEYIYSLCRDENGTEIVRMRYDTSDDESLFYTNLNISKYAVHGSKIFYEADYMKYGVYDMETAEDTSLSEGGAGIFSGDYMYFISNEHNLFRMNLEDYSCEKISENIRRIAVFKDYIIYQPYDTNSARSDGRIYRLGKGENKKIFDAYESLENGYYYDISAIQAEQDKIYIEVNSGPYYSFIAEIDIDGNIVETVYKHNSVE